MTLLVNGLRISQEVTHIIKKYDINCMNCVDIHCETIESACYKKQNFLAL